MANWDDFSNNQSALQLKANAIRNTNQEQGYGNTQMAVVMSAPVPASSRDLNVVVQGVGQGGDLGKVDPDRKRDAFTFKIRLLPQAGKKLSADAALPCTDSLSNAKDSTLAAQRLSLLPDCIIKKGHTGDIPSVGDTVVVRTYNSNFKGATGLQTTEFVEIADPSLNFRQNYSPEQRILEKKQLQETFGSNFLPSTLDTQIQPIPGDFITEEWIPEIRIVGNQVISPGSAAYLIDLVEQLQKTNSSIKVIEVTNAFRTPEKQTSIMMTYPGGDDALRELYRRSADRINAFIDAKNTGGQSAALEVVRNYASKGIFFSKHQKALGIDLRTKNFNTEQVLELMAAVRATGGAPLFEPLRCSQGRAGQVPTQRLCKNEHLHIGCPQSFATTTSEDLQSMIDARNGGTANENTDLLADAGGDADSALAQSQNDEANIPAETEETSRESRGG